MRKQTDLIKKKTLFSLNNGFKNLKKSTLAIIVASLTLSAEINAQSVETTRTYTNEGLIDLIDGPRTDVQDITDHNYDTDQNLNEVILGAGAIDLDQQYRNHNAAGQPREIEDANDVITNLVYSDQGWVKSVTVNHPSDPMQNAVTEFTYDDLGQVTCSTTAENVRTIYKYTDARYLEAEILGANSCDPDVNTSGLLMKHTFNAAGDITQTTYFDGPTDSSTAVYIKIQDYDELSRLMERRGNNGQITHLDYDANGFVTSQTDTTDDQGTTRVTRFASDEQNRLESSIDALNNPLTIEYDGAGYIHEITDARNNTTIYTYDERGNIKTLSSPDSGFTQFVFDEANNMTHITDGRQVVKSIQYDALNRITHIEYPASSHENVSYHYDNYDMDAATPDTAETSSHPKGRRTGIDNEYESVRYYYDHHGNITKQKSIISGNIYNTTYTYMLDNQIDTITYPSGIVIDYDYDSRGRINRVTGSYRANGDNTAQTYTIIDDVLYLPFGPAKQLIYGNGVTVNMDYDLDYRLDNVRVIDGNSTTLRDRDYNHDLTDNITDISDLVINAPNYSYQYDELDRLVFDSFVSSDPQTQTFDYDAVGNRTRFSSQFEWEYILKNHSIAYEPESNRIENITYGNNTPILVQYDEMGNIVQRTREQSSLTNAKSQNAIDTFTYDSDGRLRTATVQKNIFNAGILLHSTTQVATYGYNALGQRALKHVNFDSDFSQSTDFIYNTDGEIIQQNQFSNHGTPQGPALIKQWIYLNGQPIAQLDTVNNPIDGQRNEEYKLTSYYLNQHKVAEIGFNEAGIKIWEMNISAYGDEATIKHYGASGSQRIINPLRFPGQYYDIETGLNYNGMRYYDSHTGRYISSDSSGLIDGPDTYSYVNNNPVNYYDPEGQFALPIGLPIGAGAGMAYCLLFPQSCQDVLDTIDDILDLPSDPLDCPPTKTNSQRIDDIIMQSSTNETDCTKAKSECRDECYEILEENPHRPGNKDYTDTYTNDYFKCFNNCLANRGC